MVHYGEQSEQQTLLKESLCCVVGLAGAALSPTQGSDEMNSGRTNDTPNNRSCSVLLFQFSRSVPMTIGSFFLYI